MPSLPKPDGNALDGDIHPLDQKLDDAGLLGREELIPEWIQLNEGFTDLGFSDVGIVLSRGHPGLYDHLGCSKQRPKLVDDRSLDLAGRHTADRACLRSELLHARGELFPELLVRRAWHLSAEPSPSERPSKSSKVVAASRTFAAR
ncbi:hypothetical protein, partial [Mesorhizobium sp.]|uniref:hypothetical protein n=1 Tax=Mesorhizobium sp. TaxID=1871066 RepID=UPI0025802B3F